MQFEEESEVVEEENDLFIPINKPKEARFSNNCLVSNKGHLKQNDLMSFWNTEKEYSNLLTLRSYLINYYILKIYFELFVNLIMKIK